MYVYSVSSSTKLESLVNVVKLFNDLLVPRIELLLSPSEIYVPRYAGM
jgi:hypothetical protein